MPTATVTPKDPDAIELHLPVEALRAFGLAPGSHVTIDEPTRAWMIAAVIRGFSDPVYAAQQDAWWDHEIAHHVGEAATVAQRQPRCLSCADAPALPTR